MVKALCPGGTLCRKPAMIKAQRMVKPMTLKIPKNPGDSFSSLIHQTTNQRSHNNACNRANKSPKECFNLPDSAQWWVIAGNKSD